MLRKFMAVLAALLMVFSFAACGPASDPDTGGEIPNPDPGGEETTESLLYGIGEPFAGSGVEGFNYEQASKLIGALGAKTFRLWITPQTLYSGWNQTTVFSDEKLATIDKNSQLLYETYIDQVRKNGVEEITGHGNLFPRMPSTANGQEGNFVPARDTTEGSEYMQFLHKFYLIWKAVATAMPDVDVWEMGNETNQVTFLNYTGSENDSTEVQFEKLADINVDLMYYAAKGIREANPDAVIITPGLAPAYEGIPSLGRFLEEIYERIESGEFPAGEEKCSDPDEYFDGVAWHPYDTVNGITLTKEPDVAAWKEANDAVFQVMEEHGDGDKEVWFTEFGFTMPVEMLDVADENCTENDRYLIANQYYTLNEESEQKHADWLKMYFDTMEDMDYVHTCHFFRLNCSAHDAEWNGVGEVMFGLFLEPDTEIGRGFYPRRKAFALQEIYGGEGDLYQFSEL